MCKSVNVIHTIIRIRSLEQEKKGSSQLGNKKGNISYLSKKRRRMHAAS